MNVSNFIGSILYFNDEGLGERDITTIRRLCSENQIDVDIPKSVVDVYLKLYDPNGYFDLDYPKKRIVYNECRKDFSTVKEFYFDNLSVEEKNQIYCVVSRL